MSETYTEFVLQYSRDGETWFNDPPRLYDEATAREQLELARNRRAAPGHWRLIKQVTTEVVIADE